MTEPLDREASLRALGWDEGWAQALADLGDETLVPARVIRGTRRSVEVGGLPTPEERARIPGRILRDGPLARPVVGDWVALRPRPRGLEVAAILPRRSLFRRRAAGRVAVVQLIAANVDSVLLVMGLDADYNIRRLERYLALSAQSGAAPIIVLNKTDLAEDFERRIAEVARVASDAPVLAISAKRGDGMDEVTPHLRPGTTVALLGSSGVGKSTLVNALLGEELQATADVRARDGRGRHTTTAREIIRLHSGALLVDTPGMRELGLWSDGDDALDDAFEDVAGLAKACRFRDCTHGGEPGCAVAAALERGDLSEDRLGSYLKLRRELADVAQRRRDGKARLEAISKERRRWRKNER